MWIRTLAALLLAALLPIAAALAAEPASLTPDEVEKLVGAPGAKIFDANGRDTFDKGHVPGATWIAFDQVTAKDLPADRDARVVFYCKNPH